MPDSSNTSECLICASRLVKNGRTAAGTQRWKCPQCGVSSVRRRPDLKRQHQLMLFVSWLLGKQSQRELDTGTTGRSFRERIAWCWRLRPSVTITGEIYDQIQVDGLYLSSKWCCLVAITDGKVIAWQWCDREKTAAWKALLDQIPAPPVVICDGGAGLAAALKQSWPEVKIQRCLVHVQRNIRTYLTRHPRSDAGKSLWALGRSLTQITTSEQAVDWLQRLNTWHTLYGHLTRQRTHAAQIGAEQTIPSWVRAGQRWWYTHDRLRKAYRLLDKLVRNGHLFTYLDPEFEGLDIASTTNQIEGGINSGLRAMLHLHRGLPAEHQRRAIEWWLHAHAIAAPPPPAFIVIQKQQSAKPTPVDDEPIGPALYDTGLTAEEGLWTRRGWAGRT